jgi:hypothetical protein
VNTAILEAFLEKLEELGVSPALPAAWPGINFVPPDSGMWLEVLFFPNETENVAWGAESPVNAKGFFQVSVFYRPGIGQVQPSAIADLIIAHYPKGLKFIGDVGVIKKPWQSPAVTDSDKLFIPVSIPYAGLIK